MSIELFLIANLIPDIALLASVTHTLGVFNCRRLLISGVLCAAYAMLAAISPIPWKALPMQFILLLFIGWYSSGRSTSQGIRVCLLLAGGVLISGGAERLALALSPGPARSIPCAGIGATAVAMMLFARHPRRDCWEIRVILPVDDLLVRFEALVDTGNRLREPLSGLPVMIVEAELLQERLPGTGWRAIRFGGVGGEGLLQCFHPETMWIEKGSKRQRAPDVWIAVAPGRLPGPARALAPCEFAAL